MALLAAACDAHRDAVVVPDPPAAASSTAVVTPRDTTAPTADAAVPGPPSDDAHDAEPLVVLIPSDDAAITAALRAGIELAFEESRSAGGRAFELHVTATSGKWGSAAEGAVTDAIEPGALAIVAPPERRHAHLLLQLGTKLRVPVISTSAAYGVVAAGSRYVAAVVPLRTDVRDEAPVAPAFDATAPAASAFVASFRTQHAREPGAWDAVGYDAGRCIVEGERRHGLRRTGFVGALQSGAPVRGAGWMLSFAPNGAASRRDAGGK